MTGTHNLKTITRTICIVAIALTCTAVAYLPALADVTITTRTNGVETTMYMTEDYMAVVDGDGKMVFDSKNEVISMRDSETGQVQQMSKEQLESLVEMSKQAGGGDMADYQAQMKEARERAMESIQDLPPDQRKMAEEQINKQFGDAEMDMAATTYESLGRKQKVGKYNCKGYTVKTGGTETGEVWTTSLKELGISENDIIVVSKMRKFFEGALAETPFGAQALSEFASLDPTSDQFIGIPVKRTDDDGVTELVSVVKGSIDKDVFDMGGHGMKSPTKMKSE